MNFGSFSFPILILCLVSYCFQSDWFGDDVDLRASLDVYDRFPRAVEEKCTLAAVDRYLMTSGPSNGLPLDVFQPGPATNYTWRG